VSAQINWLLITLAEELPLLAVEALQLHD